MSIFKSPSTLHPNHAIALALTILLSTPAGAVAAQFQDVQDRHWAGTYIHFLSDQQIVSGYPDNTFRAEKPVTRAEFAVMLAKGKNLITTRANTQAFVDVPTEHWASGAIEGVAKKGWISGYPGNMFKPNQNITLAEMYTVVSKATTQQTLSQEDISAILDRFNDARQVPTWARGSVAATVEQGIYVKEPHPNSLHPNYKATRADVATTLAKLLKDDYRSPVKIVRGEPVNITGTLRATAQQGEYLIVTPDNQKYVFQNVTQYHQEPWFKVGKRVTLEGNLILKAMSSIPSAQVVPGQQIKWSTPEKPGNCYGTTATGHPRS